MPWRSRSRWVLYRSLVGGDPGRKPKRPMSAPIGYLTVLISTTLNYGCAIAANPLCHSLSLFKGRQ